MIRAVFSHGSIVPVDQLPDDWAEGQSLVIERDPEEPQPNPEEIDRWYRDLQALGPTVFESGEVDQMEAIWAEADRQSKEIVRKEMGL